MIPRGEREKAKKKVRSVILSSFFGGEADTETKKGSEICNSIIVFGGEPKLKKKLRSVILSSFFGGEADAETKKGSEICNSITVFWRGS